MGSGLRPDRRRLYIAGFVVTGLGLVLVLPIVVAVLPVVGQGAVRVLQAGRFVSVLCGVGGPVLVGVGFALMAAGSPGLGEAISREVDELFGMDAEEEEGEGGGDANRETPATDGAAGERSVDRPEGDEVRILVRCRDCRTLNPEAEKHCVTCGAEL